MPQLSCLVKKEKTRGNGEGLPEICTRRMLLICKYFFSEKLCLLHIKELLKDT